MNINRLTYDMMLDIVLRIEFSILFIRTKIYNFQILVLSEGTIFDSRLTSRGLDSEPSKLAACLEATWILVGVYHGTSRYGFHPLVKINETVGCHGNCVHTNSNQGVYLCSWSDQARAG